MVTQKYRFSAVLIRPEFVTKKMPSQISEGILFSVQQAMVYL